MACTGAQIRTRPLVCPEERRTRAWRRAGSREILTSKMWLIVRGGRGRAEQGGVGWVGGCGCPMEAWNGLPAEFLFATYNFSKAY